MYTEVSDVPKNSLNVAKAKIKGGIFEVCVMYRYGEEDFYKFCKKKCYDFAKEFNAS